MSSASETTARRKNRVIYADKVIQQTALQNNVKNYIVREGIQGKGAGDFSTFYYPAEDGATETTVAEQIVYIASVPYNYTQSLMIFSAVGTSKWTAPERTTRVTYLIVGGGGGSGGGYDTGGGSGGGGGMVLFGTIDVIPGTDYVVTVGDGGAGGTSIRTATPPETPGIAGQNSVFGSVVALGGGGGYGSRLPSGANNGNGGTAVSTVASTGGNGGGSNGGGGGGGGAGGDGSNKSGATGGNGGVGVSNNLSGADTTYGAGGRGANGAANNAAVAGTANTGNGARGGGAASLADEDGAQGGSGIVILQFQY
jgi:hypothetical protein